MNRQPPAHWTKITSIDMHTGGEPLRVFTSGLPPIEGRNVLEKRRHFRAHYDHIRTGTLWEPRGHADMYGAVVTLSAESDFDVFFLHNEGYSSMCGHAVIALTKLAIEIGLAGKPPAADSNGREVILRFDVPAGRVQARARVERGQAREIFFRNVPAFVYLREQQVQVADLGRVRFDVAYGGAFYAVVEAQPLGLGLTPEHCSRLIDYGRRIKRAVMEEFPIQHPFEQDLSFLYGVIFTGPAHTPAHHSRNVCVFADGEVDRSATGTGVSARAALHYARGELKLHERISVESIVGSTLSVEAVEHTTFGPYAAVIPEVGGTAHITGRHEFFFDPEDPLVNGFLCR
jgi:proline racemase